MEQILEKLNKLKGVLLLNQLGEIYLLREYTLVKDREITSTKGLWPFEKTQIKKYTFIESISLSLGVTFDFAPAAEAEVIRYINSMIDDRKRYLNLQRSLKNIGCVITTKKY